jgi:capsular polysaccharide transport system permease protein
MVSTPELLALQLRVIASLVLRETRATFGTSPFGYVWAIITPTVGMRWPHPIDLRSSALL